MDLVPGNNSHPCYFTFVGGLVIAGLELQAKRGRDERLAGQKPGGLERAPLRASPNRPLSQSTIVSPSTVRYELLKIDGPLS